MKNENLQSHSLFIQDNKTEIKGTVDTLLFGIAAEELFARTYSAQHPTGLSFPVVVAQPRMETDIRNCQWMSAVYLDIPGIGRFKTDIAIHGYGKRHVILPATIRDR